MRLPALLSLLICVFTTALSAVELEWDQTEIRVEMQPGQEEARAIYTVTNRSDKAVRIAKVKTSCGCTGSIIDRKIIEPGASTRITGTFNKGKRQGTNHNKLQVFLDSQPNPVAILHMIVSIPTLVDAQPRIVYWKPDSNKTERSIHIKLNKRYVDRISKINYDSDRLNLVTEEDPSGSADHILKVIPKDFTSLQRDTIVVKATGPNNNQGEARIHVFVQP